MQIIQVTVFQIISSVFSYFLHCNHLSIYIVSVFKFFPVLVYQFYCKQSFQYECKFRLLEYHYQC